jgi:hypothetical protein
VLIANPCNSIPERRQVWDEDRVVDQGKHTHGQKTRKSRRATSSSGSYGRKHSFLNANVVTTDMLKCTANCVINYNRSQDLLWLPLMLQKKCNIRARGSLQFSR